MAEEQAVTEAAPAAEQTVLKDFGSLDEAFDKAFPSTAEKKEVAPVEPPKEAVPAEASKAETPAPAPTKTDDLPDFLTGDKPKAEEVAPTTEPELPPVTGKESVGMKEIRTAHEKLLEKFKAQEAEMKALKEAPQQPSEATATIEQLQKQVAEMSGIIERRYIEDRPDFKQQFTDKRNNLINDAHELLKESNVDPAQWDKAMTLTGTARTEALDLIYEYLPKSTQNELGSIQREVRSLDSQKEAVLSNRQEFLKRLNQEDQQRQFAALKEHEKNTLQIMDMAEQDLVDRLGIEVYKKSGNPEHKKWNDSIDKMKADARKILLEVDDPSVMARAALLAPAAIQFRYLYHTFRDKYLEEKKKNDAISAAEPSLKSRGEAAPSEGDEKLTFAEAVARQFS